MALADYFTGMPAQREYSQVYDLAITPVYQTITDSQGHVTKNQVGMIRELVTCQIKEQVFRFEGAGYTDAHTTGSITVVDVNNVSYTFNCSPSVSDGSSGTRVMVKEEVEVRRERMSPHMWIVEVVRKGYRYYLNGRLLINGPTWM